MAQAPTAPSQESAPLLFGRYRVLEQLGDGRLATVYRATDERLQRSVLVHLLRRDLAGQENLAQRFRDEIATSARRSHPALLELFDSGEVSGRPFMVTEFAGGRPLRHLGVLTLDEALLYVRQVTGAVLACQQADVSFPPISTSNVLLIEEGRVKLVESWLIRPEDVPLDLASYRPPERTRGDPTSPASVVYSLGLLLYELVTGQRPVQGDDARAVAQAHLLIRIPPLSAIRPLLYMPSLEELLGQATARQPERRPPDAAAFAAALDTLRREVGSETQQLAPPAPPRRSRRKQEDLPEPAPDPRPNLVQPSTQDDPDPAPDTFAPTAANVRRQSFRRAIVGWVVTLGLLCGVAYGSYVGASFLVNQFFAIKLPEVSLPNLPNPFGQRKLLVVTIDNLNLRNSPGIDTQVIAQIAKDVTVEQIEGPVSADGVEWVRVRGEVDGQKFEGWMSLKYLREG